MSESLNRDNITRNQGNQFSQWQWEPWEPHWFTHHLQWMRSPPALWGTFIDLHAFFQIQFLIKKHSIPVLATSREVKQKFLVIWEDLEPWCFLFHILFLSTPLSGHMNNAKDLVAWGAMGDRFKQSPLPGAITSEGKSSKTQASILVVPQWQVKGHSWTTGSTSAPVMDHRKIGGRDVLRCGRRTSGTSHRG